MVYSVSSDTLVQVASGLSGYCVKKQCGLVVSEDAQLSTFASLESVWELQRWDKTVTTNLDTKKIGGKKNI
jgi:hypothetical protein